MTSPAVPPWLRVVGPALAVIVVQLVLFPVSPGVWLQGLVIGLLNALVVLGMMLVYRANRVINMAQASVGALPASLGIGMVLFGAPSLVTAGWLGVAAGAVIGLAAVVLGRRPPATAAATGAGAAIAVTAAVAVMARAGYFGGLVIGLVAAVVIGLAIDLVVVRRFRRSPRLVLTVATIGLAQFLAVGALLIPRLWGRTDLAAPNKTFRMPGSFQLELGTTVFHTDELVAVVVAVLAIAAVALVLARTDIGMAVRAAAERSDRAAMLAVPVGRLEAGVWVVASVLAFIGTYLQAGILGLDLSTGVGLRDLVAALAAMALAGFGSLPGAVSAAVAIGVLSVASGPAGGHQVTTTDVVMALVVLVGLLAQRAPRRRADRGEVSSWQASVDPAPVPTALARLGVVRHGRTALVGVGLVVALLLPEVLSPSQDFRAAMVASLAVLALSVVVLTGWTGEVTLGQMGLAAVGAVVTAYATVEWQFDLVLALPLAGLATAVVAVVLGLPSLRWQGLFMAVTTLAFGVAVVGWVLNPSQADWIPRGVIERRPLLATFDLSSDATMYRVCLVILVLALVAVAGIRRTRTGRVLRAVRDNAPGVQAYGVKVPVARLTAFALSGFLAGVAGGMIVYVSEAYDVGTFAPDQGLNVFISAVVGGVGSAFGAVLGAVVLDGSRNFLTGAWSLLPSSVGVLVVLMFLPGGLAELVYRLRQRVLVALAANKEIDLARVDVALDDMVDAGHKAAAREHPVVHADPDEPPLPDALSIRALDVAYGPVQVLFGVDLDVRPGEITALLGTNGAGKTTLLRAIGGVAPVVAGSVTLGPVDLRDLEPDQIAARGVAQMPGGQGVFSGLTVEENLRVAAWQIRADRARVSEKISEAQRRFPVLQQRFSDQAGDLSGGQQQQLALAMALMVDPEVLLIDELSLGLAPLVVEQLLEELRALRDAGTTIVIVEQSVNVALSVADHAYFMEKGAIRFSGSAAELIEQPELLQAIYLQGTRDALAAGDEAHEAHEAQEGATAPQIRSGRVAPAAAAPGSTSTDAAPVPALAVDALSVAFGGISAVRAVSMEVEAGEIVGLIGPNGAGKTTLLDLISGFTGADSGQIFLHGREIDGLTPPMRARAGLGRSFQDARLFPGLTVTETLSTALERWIEGGDPLSGALRLPSVQLTEAAISERVTALVEMFGLTALVSSRISELSTGSRRMVDLACVVAHGPSVVLLDEPSSGIAQSEAEALAPLLVDLRRTLGVTLVVIEHDISLISSIADRLVALDEGAVVTDGPPSEVLAHPAVVESYLGTSTHTVNRSDHGVRADRRSEPAPRGT